MMRIRVRDMPQANSLRTVVATAEAVTKGYTTFQDISRAIAMTEREGRYYRRAAEILGLIAPAAPNRSRLTRQGRELLASRGAERRRLLAEAVLRSRLVQRVVPFLETAPATGRSRVELEQFIESVTAPAGPTMVPRRTSTVTAWLTEVGLLQRDAERHRLLPPPHGTPPVEYGDDEPLLPSTWKLTEYEDVEHRTTAARGLITLTVDDTRRERANTAHEALTRLVAERIRARGAIPRRNRFVDLAAAVDDGLFMFEVKTTTNANVHSQVRRGMSQLYEYRYVQQAPKANLVLVIQNPFPRALRWMRDYLSADRGIFPVWDGDLRTLHCHPEHRERLAFLLQG